jgi:hypothetical protein
VTTAPDRLATVLGDRYRIERQLGTGGMATVYLARDLKHDRVVALKVLRPALGAVLGPDRFLAEIKITARLDHPHILTLIDSGAADGFLYYVLPLVRGESLRQKLGREKQLGLEEALIIAKQVASALDYAHRQGVIHRDIKPENILLQEGEAVLTDFGIALAVKEAGGNRLTETGLSLGTPQYMSPEQATGDRTLDARSDTYSLAAVLYEMLAGEPPVTGPNAQVMIAKLLTERPIRLAVVRDSVPGSVDAAVTRALSKVPADRFTTAGEFAHSLVASSTVSPANASTRPRWLMVAGVGVAALVLGTAASLALRGRATVAPAFTPQFDQLTTDGNARSPALSPDGTRLAYVARDCDERERCTERLVVRDIGNAGAITVLKGARIEAPAWAADGRFLIAKTLGGLSNVVVVPALGGTPRVLPGYGVGVIGTTDTMIVSGVYVPGRDSLVWLQVVTASDALIRDSIVIRQPMLYQIAYPAPRGGRIALVGNAAPGTALRLLDRAGRVTDSLPTFAYRTLRSVQWTPQADALVLQVELREGNPAFVPPGAVPVPSVLVRHQLSADGRFIGRTDTLMTLERGSQLSNLRAGGSALLSQGPVEAVVYALERSGPGRLDFRSRRLAASTAGLGAHISRDGATVWLQHGRSGPGSLQRNTFLPIDGGPERPFNLPPGAEISTDWTRPVSSGVLYAFRDGSGQARLIEVDVATGRSREVMSLPPRTSWVFTIPGGGYGIVDVGSGSARIVRRPGKPDTTWTAPPTPGREFTIPGDATSVGRAFVEFSPIVVGDTIWVRGVPLDGGAASPTVAMMSQQWFGILSDGSYEWIRTDSTQGLGWYRIPPGGSRSVRLGDAPVQGTGTKWEGWDGRRFVVTKPVYRPDVFLLRNFGELLSR